jgi:hypothetical protein
LPANDRLSTYVLGLARDGLFQPSWRNGDMVADEITLAAGADPLEQLVAYTGRRP